MDVRYCFLSVLIKFGFTTAVIRYDDFDEGNHNLAVSLLINATMYFCLSMTKIISDCNY